MEPIKLNRGKTRSRNKIQTNQPGLSDISGLQGIRAPRPTQPQPIKCTQPPVSMQRPPLPPDTHKAFGQSNNVRHNSQRPND